MTIKEKYDAIPKKERKRLAQEIYLKPPLLWWFMATVVIPSLLSRPIGNRLLSPTASAFVHFSAELLFVALFAAVISYVLLRPRVSAAVVKAYENA
jgi:hypothetical protein